ncbi:MAG TPA: hypothetical protein VGQ37_22415 [Vicinamibacterales bacterium]|jgi:hypothetical protein|nr:hypothetical protein [Vicinamibacterales bacterium]
MSLDQVLTELPENTDPQDTDLLLIVDDPAGTPDTQKITVGTFRETDPNRPTDDQKAALAGTSGAPSATNKYVTAESSLADLATRSASDLSSGTLAPARGGTGAGELTAGSIPFIGASGVFSQDNAKLFWDNTNKRLGIGTAAPQTPLAVNANAAGAPGSDSSQLAQFNQADGLLASLGIDSYGHFPTITWKRANTGQSAKSGLSAGDVFGRLRGFGYGSTAYSTSARAIFDCAASESWTDTQQGALWIWSVTAAGGISTAERMRLHDSGGLSLNNVADPGTGGLLATGSIRSNGATGGVGYATGAGGTVTQATSKSTGVTLNTACGRITMNNAALTAGTIVTFTLTSSAISFGDVLVLNHVSGGTAGAYGLNAQCGAGSASLNVRNHTTGSLSEAIVIAFAVIKAVTS